MKIVFYLFFVLQVSFGQNGSGPKSVREIPQYQLNSTKDADSGTCLPPAPSGSVNWWGVASAVSSWLPGIGSIFGGLFGIMGNLGISSSGESDAYGEEFNKCIKGMIRRELTETQLGDAKKVLEQIGGELNDFMEDIKGDIDENIISQNIIISINNMYLKVDALEVLFDNDDDMFMSFKFIGLLLDGLAVESISRLAFLARLKELNYNKKDFCRHIDDMQDKLNSRYDHFFKSNYLHNELYEGTYSDWPNKLSAETEACTMYPGTPCRGDDRVIINDDYTDTSTQFCHTSCSDCYSFCSLTEIAEHVYYNKAVRFVHETMDNVDKYLSNAKKTHELTLDLIKNLGHDVNCWDDILTTTTPILPSPTTPSGVGPSIDECVEAMGELHDYFTSESSMAEQSEIFKATVCPQVEDPSSCDEHFGNFYEYAAICLHDSFFSQPEDLCDRILSSYMENKAKDWTCNWCSYTLEALAFLWTQPEALDHGLYVLHGECFCGRAQDEGWDYNNCHEEVDGIYPPTLAIGASVLIEQQEEICQEVVGVC